MSKHDLLTLILKTFGLYWLARTIVYAIPDYLYMAQVAAGSGYDIVFRILSVIVLVVSAGLAYALIINAAYLVDRFKLTKGFENNKIFFNNFSQLNLVAIACIIMGGYLIVIDFPDFIGYSVRAFADSVRYKGVDGLSQAGFGTADNYFAWIMCGVRSLIGYFLITNYRTVAKWLISKSKLKNELDDGLEA